jgi:hypothetical protein
VTPEDLKEKLKNCFLAGPGDKLVATHFIPFLQEKMS